METLTELAPPAHNVLLTDAMFGGPQRACIAMMMQRAGVVGGNQIPEPCHVSVFGHHNTDDPADLATALGAARSFGGHQMEVEFIGQPSKAVCEQRPDWLRTMNNYSHLQADFDRSPDELDIFRFLNDPQGPWLLKLDAAPQAFSENWPSVSPRHFTFQPTVVVGLMGDEVVVHNPGNERVGLGSEAFQALKLTQALGQTASDRSHVSLLAVRSLKSQANGVMIHPTTNVA